MRWKSLFFVIVLTGLVAVLILPHYFRQNESSQTLMKAPAVNGLRALLFIPDTHWNRNGKPDIYIALQNESKSPITLDRRLDMGGSIRMTIEQNGTVVNYTPYHVTIARPSKSDLVAVKPGEFLGRRLVVSKEDVYNEKTRKEMDSLSAGAAKLKIEYTTCANVYNPSLDKTPYWFGKVASNSVTVEIE
ncbi:MAG: hypothetical protein ABFD46_00770 [Armatimonadota bacterium]